MNFILTNWKMILTLLAVTAVIIYLMARGETKFLKYLLFTAVTDAENEYGGGTGELKLSAVMSAVYANLPKLFRAVVPEKLLLSVVEKALIKAKEAWAANPKLLYNDDTDAVKPYSDSGGGIVTGTIPVNYMSVESADEMTDTSKTYYCMNAYWIYNGSVWLAYDPDTGEAIVPAPSDVKVISADKINFTGLVDFDKHTNDGETSI